MKKRIRNKKMKEEIQILKEENKKLKEFIQHIKNSI